MPSDLSTKQLWEAFLREHDSNSHNTLADARKNQKALDLETFKPLLSECRFKDLFASEFGYLRFYKPKTDKCKTCLIWKSHIATLSENLSKQQALDEYNHHRLMAQTGYRVIDYDCEMAVQSRLQDPNDRFKWVDTLVFDHQKKFDVPHLVTKQARFGHQLSVFNFGVYNAYSDQHRFHVWSEWDGACGSDEVIYCLLHVLEAEKEAMGCGILNLICDSCGGQNKNRFMLSFAAELARPGSAIHRFGEVNIKFPEVGHTFLPNDRIFSVIAQFTQRHSYYDPETLYELIKKSFRAQRPQIVTIMTRNMFKNYGEHFEARYKGVLLHAKFIDGSKWESPTPVNLRDDCRWVNFGRYHEFSHVGEMWIRHSLLTAEAWKKYSICSPGSTADPVELLIKNDRPCPLDAIKMQSCHELASSIPNEYRHLYPAPDPLALKSAGKAVQAKNKAKRSSRSSQ